MADYLTDNGCPLSATETSAMDYKSADKSAANRIGSTSAAANITLLQQQRCAKFNVNARGRQAKYLPVFLCGKKFEFACLLSSPEVVTLFTHLCKCKHWQCYSVVYNYPGVLIK